MDDRELRLEEQDLRLLKNIITNPQIGIEFANTYDHTLFIGDSSSFAKAVIDYVKTYRAIPTKRVLLDQHQSNQSFCHDINEIWNEIENVQITSSEYRYDLDKLKNRYTEQKIVNIKDFLQEDHDIADVDKQIRTVQKQIEDIKRIRTGQKQGFVQKTLRDYMPEYQKKFAAKAKHKDLDQGILTGYSKLDWIKRGLQPAEMLIVAAETAGGKSLLLNNMAIQMWMQTNTLTTDPKSYVKGYNVLYFSLEMPYEACARRTLAKLSKTPNYALRDAAINIDQAQQLNLANKFIKNYPYEFEIVDISRGVTASEIELRFLDALNRYQPDVVVVDYLGLMEDQESNSDDWLKLGHIAGQLHELARMYNIVMMTAVQLNRNSGSSKAERETNRVGIHRVGRSSLILHHADLAIQIETRPDEKGFSDMACHIIKNRDGELGNFSLKKDFKCSSVEDQPWAPDEENSNKDNFQEDLTGYLNSIGWYN